MLREKGSIFSMRGRAGNPTSRKAVSIPSLGGRSLSRRYRINDSLRSVGFVELYGNFNLNMTLLIVSMGIGVGVQNRQARARLWYIFEDGKEPITFTSEIFL